MKILYYNWVQFDNPSQLGGGVNIYQYNLVEYFTKNSDFDVYFLSSGWTYNPLVNKTYLRKVKSIFSSCQTFEIVNSPVIAPAYMAYRNLKNYLYDNKTKDIFYKFISEYGPFDIIHFNNIEGISINVLSLKNLFPNTKFIMTIHNYYPICPLVNLFSNKESKICSNFNDGKSCLNCNVVKYNNEDEYYFRCKSFFYSLLPTKSKNKFLKEIIRLVCKLYKLKSSKIFPKNTLNDEKTFLSFRNKNILFLNKYLDLIISVSNRTRDIMISHGLQEKKVITDYIGTKLANNFRYNEIINKEINFEYFTIAYLGYSRIDKGYFFMIDSLSKLDKNIAKKINIVLAVSDFDEATIANLKYFHNIKVYKGYSHKQLPSILENVNLGIIPVLWEDNLPQVAIEMVIFGIPILCSSFGGASELCSSSSFKFKGADTNDFLKQLSNLVLNPNLLVDFWKHLNKPLTMKAHCESLISHYQKI